MRKVYISLPITGHDVEKQRGKAAIMAAILACMYYEPVNPFTNGLDEKDSWEAHLDKDLAMLRECDMIAFASGWETSKGCVLEAEKAVEWNIPTLDISFW